MPRNLNPCLKKTFSIQLFIIPSSPSSILSQLKRKKKASVSRADSTNNFKSKQTKLHLEKNLGAGDKVQRLRYWFSK